MIVATVCVLTLFFAMGSISPLLITDDVETIVGTKD